MSVATIMTQYIKNLGQTSKSEIITDVGGPDVKTRINYRYTIY